MSIAAIILLGALAGANDTEEPKKLATKAAFVELGGPGLVYSLNFEWRPVAPLGLRVGASLFPLCMFGDCAVVPIALGSVHWIFFDGDHHLELGAGASVAPEDDARFLSPSIGYRYHPREGGFLFRAVFSPVFRMNDPTDALPWAGLSFGWSSPPARSL
jgi:hypothetical protein